jgi:hypothetical protein
LKLIDPALVLPDWAPPIALEADLRFHAIPAAILTLDLLLLSPPWTISALPSLALSGTIAFAYWFWIEQCYKYNDFYPYPIFDVFDTTSRVALFGFSAMIMSTATFTLAWLYSIMNGVEVSAKRDEKPGKVTG